MHTSTSAAPASSLSVQASEALRKLALNEEARELFCFDPRYRPFMQRAARRYIAGQTIGDALGCAQAMAARGHAASIEYMGESVRNAARADSETGVFLAVIEALDRAGQPASISLDLSHVGLLVDPELGYRNLCRIARAAAAGGREVMISAEGSERAGAIHDIYARLHEEAQLHHVGMTVQARLHRTESDLKRLMAYPGKIRLVKGAFLEPAEVAWPRGSAELQENFLRFARELLGAGHLCSIATHDGEIQRELCEFISRRGLQRERFEFETLIGLGTEQLDGLQRQGFPTREYAGFGDEYFLYVVNRIAEEPSRLLQALIDVTADTVPA
ncbi:MAG TPA: proline dehydrogenase family protein [Burkholderiaceae bacterium]